MEILLSSIQKYKNMQIILVKIRHKKGVKQTPETYCSSERKSADFDVFFFSITQQKKKNKTKHKTSHKLQLIKTKAVQIELRCHLEAGLSVRTSTTDDANAGDKNVPNGTIPYPRKPPT